MKAGDGISRRKNMAYIAAIFLLAFAGSYVDIYLKQLQSAAQSTHAFLPIFHASSSISSKGE
ncbi:MAG: hypothetical protein ACC707_14025 [Thiohalomonadales bacterium]